MPPQYRVLIADILHEQGKAYLAAQPDIIVDVATGLSEAALCERIADYDGLVVRSKTRVTAPVIAAAKRLKVIGRAGIGVDNIDVAAATDNGIVVCNTPDSNATTTAELAIAHLLSLSRNLPQADRSVRAGEWQPARFIGAEVTGKTVGVIGFGTIGRIFTERCLGLKMHVLVYDPFVTPKAIEERGAEACDLDVLLARADYVSLHCPMMDKTRNLLNAAKLAAMKPGARLINCARGGLVDEVALHDVLKSGHLAGAALDVFADEPPKGSPLLTLESLVATPHLGASTEEAQQAVSIKIAETIAAFLTTGAVNDAINLPRIPADQLSRARHYQELAHALGSVIGELAKGPIVEFDVAMFGRAAEFDPRTITTQALAGLLGKSVATPVNQVNAGPLAQRQGIKVVETRSEAMQDYVSLIEIHAKTATGVTSVAGTLLGGRHPRIVRVDGHDVEAVPEGHILFTRHEDRPGVVGALGGILGREGVNISRMQIGNGAGKPEAIALIGISAPLTDAILEEVRRIPAIRQAVQIEL